MGIENIENLIMRSLIDLIKILDIKNDGPIEPSTALFGPRGILKSMELVSLIVDLEEKIQDEYGLSLVLADERAMSQEKSPFRSVSSLAQYICTLMDEASQKESRS
jgi:acyl carrier protein